jgi:hypothetical protein
MAHMTITKILVSTAIAAVCAVSVAAPAGADPNAFGADPNPFGGLSCNCRETAPAHSPAQQDDIHRGIREGEKL